MVFSMVFLAAMCVLFGVAAYRLPLTHLIAPAVGGTLSYAGTWWAGPATVALIVALAVGMLAVMLTTGRKPRECPTYTGGELLEETYVNGVAPGAQRDVEVTGVDFYRTVRDLWGLRTAYKLAEKKVFDAYDVGTGFVFYFIEALRKAHSGVLPLYLTWYLVGALLVIAVFLGGLG
jgi:hypothetical protein